MNILNWHLFVFWSLKFFLSGLVIASPAISQGARDGDISRLLSIGQVEAARAMLETGAPTQVDRLFFDARLLKSKGRLTESIELFRRVLQMEPNRLDARRELAHTLMLNRDFGPAEFHFKQLLAIDKNQKMRAGYRRFLAYIRRENPFGITGYFSLLPSTNMNRGTKKPVLETSLGDFIIADEAKARSGIGRAMGVSGYARHALSANARVTFDWEGSLTQYQAKHNGLRSLRLALRYEWATPAGNWFIIPRFQKIWQRGASSRTVRGLNARVSRQLTGKDQFTLNLLRERRENPSSSYLDGPFASLALTLKHQLSPSRSLQAGIILDQSRPQSEHLRYRGAQISLEAGRMRQGGLHTGFGFHVGHRAFDADFPLHNLPRDDQFIRLTAAVHHERMQVLGYAPKLFCTYTVHGSNVAFYDYKVTECQMSLTRNF